MPPRDSKGGPVEIGLAFKITAIPTINTVDSMLTVNYFLKLEWSDQRLLFANLNPLEDDNALTDLDKKSIWAPNLVFVNALGEH